MALATQLHSWPGGHWLFVANTRDLYPLTNDSNRAGELAVLISEQNPDKLIDTWKDFLVEDSIFILSNVSVSYHFVSRFVSPNLSY